MNALHDDAIVGFDERGAPRLLTLDQTIERALQRADVEHALHVPLHGDVIRRAGILGLREHPETLLGERGGTVGERGSSRLQDRDRLVPVHSRFRLAGIDQHRERLERLIVEQCIEP